MYLLWKLSTASLLRCVDSSLTRDVWIATYKRKRFDKQLLTALEKASENLAGWITIDRTRVGNHITSGKAREIA